jgi:hypothetical protein
MYLLDIPKRRGKMGRYTEKLEEIGLIGELRKEAPWQFEAFQGFMEALEEFGA